MTWWRNANGYLPSALCDTPVYGKIHRCRPGRHAVLSPKIFNPCRLWEEVVPQLHWAPNIPLRLQLDCNRGKAGYKLWTFMAMVRVLDRTPYRQQKLFCVC
jgi:hypothetical protein